MSSKLNAPRLNKASHLTGQARLKAKSKKGQVAALVKGAR
jgi:hypothetical protein